MKTNIVMFIILLASSLEIFLRVFSKVITKIFTLLKKDSKIPVKIDIVFKLIWVALLLVSAVYFMFKGVDALAKLFGIPLDKSIIDIFK
ncbi:hypothetical protein [Abyssisolibacter fermentans]|uniref:hypothetical protein n=1 Tax=Abyssisolibacter fermentans TaxID=1766203 RepID=UPI00082FAF29|nr:hypothetical protein [Abyssisolibacter fermentans]